MYGLAVLAPAKGLSTGQHPVHRGTGNAERLSDHTRRLTTGAHPAGEISIGKIERLGSANVLATGTTSLTRSSAALRPSSSSSSASVTT